MLKLNVKRTGFWLFIVCMMFFLAACNEKSNSKEQLVSAEKEPETVTFQAANGEVKVPKNPRRIVLQRIVMLDMH